MSDPAANDPTRRLNPGRLDAPSGTQPGAPAGPQDRTRQMPRPSTADPVPYTEEPRPGSGEAAYERTAVQPKVPAAPPLSYTEDYNDGREATRLDPAHDGYGPDPLDDGPVEVDGRRTWPTLTLVLVSLAALLIGVVLTLLLLPEEAPLVADEQSAQQLVDTQQALTDAEARIAELEAMLAERDAQIAQLQSQAEGDQAAADQAQADRDAALAERQQALDERDAALAQRESDVQVREEQVAAREAQAAQAEQQAEQGQADPGQADQAPEDGTAGGEGTGFPEINLPADLPQVDEEVARGVIERFIDRLQSLFGG